MKIKIFTPQKIVLEREAESITLPGKDGQLTAMDGHDILATTLNAGRLFFRYKDSEDKPRMDEYEIGQGIAEITKDTVSVFVESAKIKD